MAINRAPWTALVDDNGTNTTGSVWNKTAIKDVLLDPIDAALVLAPLVVGAHADVALAAGQADNVACPSATILFLSAPSATYLTGLVAPAATGTIKILLNVSGSGALITLAHLYASSAANQIIGSGYGNTDLTVWKAVLLIYDAPLQKWIVLKA